MTRLTPLLASLSLAATAALAALPVSAQTPVPMPPPTPVQSISSAALAPLVIPAPPGGKLRVEMDARNEDLLGLAKSFLKGIGETGAPGAVPAGTTPAPPNPLAQAIADGNLAAMLKDVNHVHIVVYEIPGAASASPSVITITQIKPKLKKSASVTVITPAPPPPPVVPPVPAFDSNSFYESAFAAEGAHRIMFTDVDPVKLIMVGFPNRQGFAFAASGGGYVVVERSDGYPDLEALTAFISRVTTTVANSQMGKKMMSTVDPSKLTLPDTAKPAK